MKKLNYGFTLVELLTVMAVMALMAAISLFALENAREGGRDARRKADLENIRQAMEFYRSDCNQYPTSSPTTGATFVGTGVCAGNTYLNPVPKDPTDGTSYCWSGSATSYCVCADLEQTPSTALTCGGGCTCDYVVRSL